MSSPISPDSPFLEVGPLPKSERASGMGLTRSVSQSNLPQVASKVSSCDLSFGIFPKKGNLLGGRTSSHYASTSSNRADLVRSCHFHPEPEGEPVSLLDVWHAEGARVHTIPSEPDPTKNFPAAYAVVGADLRRDGVLGGYRFEGINYKPYLPKASLDWMLDKLGCTETERSSPESLHDALQRKDVPYFRIYEILHDYFPFAYSGQAYDLLFSCLMPNISIEELRFLDKEILIDFFRCKRLSDDQIFVIISYLKPREAIGWENDLLTLKDPVIRAKPVSEILSSWIDDQMGFKDALRSYPEKVFEYFYRNSVKSDAFHQMLGFFARPSKEVLEEYFNSIKLFSPAGEEQLDEELLLELEQIGLFQVNLDLATNLLFSIKDAKVLRNKGFKEEVISQIIQVRHGYEADLYRVLREKGHSHKEIDRIMQFLNQRFHVPCLKELANKVFSESDGNLFLSGMNNLPDSLIPKGDISNRITLSYRSEKPHIRVEFYQAVVNPSKPMSDFVLSLVKITGDIDPLEGDSPQVAYSWRFAELANNI